MTARLLTFALVLAVAPPAAAQPCASCARGDKLVQQFSLEPLRAIAGEIADLRLDDPVTPEQFTKIIELRARNPALLRLGAVAEGDLPAIAASLCGADTGTCTEATARALRCLADRCATHVPNNPRYTDVLKLPPNCHQYRTRKRSAPLGLGIDMATGWHRSEFPNDGRAWSMGIESRLRFTRRFGIAARIDRVTGRDAAEDADQNGTDDVYTGSITRVTALGGPSIVLDNTRFENTTRFLRLDLLGGYLSMRTQPGESGPAAGFDLTYQLSVIKFGARFVQGFGDARDASMLLVHFGFIIGAAPPFRDDTDCGAEPASRSSRLALGFDMPLVGYGFWDDLGVSSTGWGMELSWYLMRRLDAVVRADILDFPGYERERAVHQAALAGIRIDHAKPRDRSDKTGWFSTYMAGYSHRAGTMPTTTGSGPVGDVSLGWGIVSDDAAAYLRMHARFGISPENVDYRALFISGGFDIHFDPRFWRKRI